MLGVSPEAVQRRLVGQLNHQHGMAIVGCVVDSITNALHTGNLEEQSAHVGQRAINRCARDVRLESYDDFVSDHTGWYVTFSAASTDAICQGIPSNNRSV